MKTCLWAGCAAALLASCALPHTELDAAIDAQRKAYAQCTVTKAFLMIESEMPESELARNAMRRCASERDALQALVRHQSAANSAGAARLDGYMAELDRTMLEHLTLRLTQARTQQARRLRS